MLNILQQHLDKFCPKRQQQTRNDLIIKEIDNLYGAFAGLAEERKTQKGLPLKNNKIHDMIVGEGETECVENKPERAIAFSKFSAGSIAPEHEHESETETIFIIEGVVRIKLSPKNKRFYYKELGSGETIIIPSGLPHTFYFLTYTEIIAITIPADPNFPK